MQKVGRAELPAVPPGGTKPNSTHIFLQAVAIVLGIGAASWSAFCALDLASRPGIEPEMGFEVLASFLSLPFSVIALAVGLMSKKGIPWLRRASIITSLVAVCLPIVSNSIFQRKEAERDRHFAKLKADIQAERLRNIPGGPWEPQRRLTDQQIAILVQDLSQLKGHKLKIGCFSDNPESRIFASDFVEVFKRAGWLGLDGSEIQLAPYSGTFIGLFMKVNPADGAEGGPPSDSAAFVNALIHAGVLEPRFISKASWVPAGEMELYVGRNRPQPRAD